MARANPRSVEIPPLSMNPESPTRGIGVSPFFNHRFHPSPSNARNRPMSFFVAFPA
jgi:hypothetical protein